MPLALAMHEGGTKYGPFNYRDVPVAAHIYVDAALGHIMAYADGEDLDPDSGIHHLGKAMACCAILIDGIITNRVKDDRHTLNKPGQGSFSRDPLKYPQLVDPQKIKALLRKPYTKSIGKPNPLDPLDKE
jgi:hypothetical protein